jgi:protein-disulfide isomerase
MLRSRVLPLIVAVVVAAVVVIGAIVLSSSGEDGAPSGSSAPVAGGVKEADLSREMLDGIPQDGAVLGDPDAPAVMVEVADLQCPFCAEAGRQALPRIIEDYVRPGRVKLEFVNLAFLGEDSTRLARAAQAAGLQDRLWDVVDLVYRNQGQENSGYATETYIRQVLEAVPGLDVERALREREDPRVEQALARDQAYADRKGIQSTPTFLAGRTAAAAEPLELSELTGEALAAALQAKVAAGA